MITQVNVASSAASIHNLTGRADPWNNLLAGGVGGLLSLTVGHPFDTIKVRLQTMKPAICTITGSQVMPYSGAVDCLRQSIRADGVIGLYRGMGALALFSIPRFSLLFYSNSWGRILGKKLEAVGKPSPKEFSTVQILCGGVFSQTIVAPLIVNPLERAKVLLQTSPEFKGQVDCFRHIIKHEGLAGLLRGTSLTLARDIPSFCTYFMVYENLRTWWKQKRKLDSSQEINLFSTALLGGVSGMCGWAIAIPVDSLKNRHQVCMGKKSIFSTLSTVVLEGGFLQLYRGSMVVLVRAFPANAATFVGYEYTIKLLELR